MTPKPESRISALEKRASILEAAIEELSSDQAEELRAIRQEIKDSYKEIGDFFVKLDEGLEAVKATMASKEDLSKLRDEMKADMAAMENRINANIATLKEDLLDAIKPLWQQRPSE